MIADRVLSLIIEQPGISITELRAALRDVNRNSVGTAIGMLREQGFILRTHRGTYRSPNAVALEPKPTVWPQGGITPVPLSRLMAGR